MNDVYQVAVVVTAEAAGVDYADASAIAVDAVKRALHSAGEFSPETRSITLHVSRSSDAWTAEVRAVQDLAQALLTGKVRLEVAPPRPADDQIEQEDNRD